MRAICLFFLLLAATGAAFAQDKTEPISPERPGFTNGTDTVALSRYQLEAGYAFSHTGGDREHALGDGGQLRFPLRKNVEVRAGLPTYFWERGTSAPTDGFGDASVSVKYRFLNASDRRRAAPSLAFIGGLELPTGKRRFREDDYSPSAALEAQWQLTEKYGLSANAVYNGVRQNGVRYDEFGGAVCLNIALSPVLGTYAELFRVSDTGAGTTHQNFFDTGITCRLNANTAFDINGGVGVFGTRDTWFIGGGIARRW